MHGPDASECETDQLLSLDARANSFAEPRRGVSISPGYVLAYVSIGVGNAGAIRARLDVAGHGELLVTRQVVIHERAYKQPSLFTVQLTSPCARALRSSARARDRRDMTVPMAVPVI